ncbi:hypothetical protein HHL19_17940 [Streptomyces sp. R302]|nr:hypothetical protein [Streptomyces sp. R301]NML80512.1 hypothetical protein [Streptomyces sp. R302]
MEGNAFDDLRRLHARVVRDSVHLVARVTPADLTRPTPCAGWDLKDLLDHMTAQHHGFAAAGRRRRCGSGAAAEGDGRGIRAGGRPGRRRLRGRRRPRPPLRPTGVRPGGSPPKRGAP